MAKLCGARHQCPPGKYMCMMYYTKSTVTILAVFSGVLGRIWTSGPGEDARRSIGKLLAYPCVERVLLSAAFDVGLDFSLIFAAVGRSKSTPRSKAADRSVRPT